MLNFTDVTLRREANTLIVTVVENPIINRIAFEGNKRLTDETLRLVTARQRAGLATPFDVERAQTDAARARAAIPPLETLVTVSRRQSSPATHCPPSAATSSAVEKRPAWPVPPPAAQALSSFTAPWLTSCRWGQRSVGAKALPRAKRAAARGSWPSRKPVERSPRGPKSRRLARLGSRSPPAA